MVRLLVFALLVALAVAVPTQLTYTLKTNYVYNVSGVVQNNGYDTGAQDYVPGFYSYMQAFMVMQPIQETATSYTFVMNLFGTTVSVANTSSGAAPADPNGQSLGEDMYFVQLKTGVITEIMYYTEDSIYYVDVKLGAINAFQTSIVAVGADKVVLESDPIGNHSAQVTGSAGSDGSLVLTKVFSQTDFSAFPDPTVTSKNMFINAKAVTGVHASGYITNSTLSQTVILTNGGPANTKRSLTNSTGFDMELSALGSLHVNYANVASSLQSTVFAEPREGELITSNMFDFAVKSSLAAKFRAFSLNIEDTIATILSTEAVSIPALTKVGTHFKYNPQEIEQLAPLFEKGFLANPIFRDRLFFVLTMIQHEEYLLKYGLDSSDCDIITRSVLAAAHFEASPAIDFALARIATLSSCPFAQGSAKSILENAATAKVQNSDFPFNKSFTGSMHMGGKVAAAEFIASFFTGTNFNCNTTLFNYEAYSYACAYAYFFGFGLEAFDARVVYGQDNGATLADALTLRVWGSVVYNQPIPALPCKQGTYPLAHTAPGFSVSHTLWVSIIPVVFSSSAGLDLSLSWQWTLCATSLVADVGITGAGSIFFSGSSYTDLLLLRAGFELEGSFATTLIPHAYIHGTTCDVGCEIDADTQPVAAALTSYYQWETCKLIFVDCKWGKYNSQTWWSYNQPAKDIVLYKATFPIAH